MSSNLHKEKSRFRNSIINNFTKRHLIPNSAWGHTTTSS